MRSTALLISARASAAARRRHRNRDGEQLHRRMGEFATYLKVGVPVTLLTLVVAVLALVR